MEDGKWVHGTCGPEDPVREARLGCYFFFAVIRWTKGWTKTEEIQGNGLESEISHCSFGGGSQGRAYAGVYIVLLRLYSLYRVLCSPFFREED